MEKVKAVGHRVSAAGNDIAASVKEHTVGTYEDLLADGNRYKKRFTSGETSEIARQKEELHMAKAEAQAKEAGELERAKAAEHRAKAAELDQDAEINKARKATKSDKDDSDKDKVKDKDYDQIRDKDFDKVKDRDFDKVKDRDYSEQTADPEFRDRDLGIKEKARLDKLTHQDKQAEQLQRQRDHIEAAKEQKLRIDEAQKQEEAVLAREEATREVEKIRKDKDMDKEGAWQREGGAWKKDGVLKKDEVKKEDLSPKDKSKAAGDSGISRPFIPPKDRLEGIQGEDREVLRSGLNDSITAYPRIQQNQFKQDPFVLGQPHEVQEGRLSNDPWNKGIPKFDKEGRPLDNYGTVGAGAIEVPVASETGPSRTGYIEGEKVQNFGGGDGHGSAPGMTGWGIGQGGNPHGDDAQGPQGSALIKGQKEHKVGGKEMDGADHMGGQIGGPRDGDGHMAGPGHMSGPGRTAGLMPMGDAGKREEAADGSKLSGR